MAIALDSTGTATQSLSNSVTFSHTCSGSDRILFVNAAAAYAGLGTVSSVTYNGVAMTLIDFCNPQANFYQSLWYLVAPDTGTHNVVITGSGGAVLTTGGSASYTGASQTGVPDSSAKATTIGTSLNQSTTTVADNSWVVGACITGATSITAGAGITSRSELDSANGSTLLGDSNGVKSPAGSYSMTFTNGAADSMGMVMASFKPVTVVTPKRLLTMGIGQ